MGGKDDSGRPQGNGIRPSGPRPEDATSSNASPASESAADRPHQQAGAGAKPEDHPHQHEDESEAKELRITRPDPKQRPPRADHHGAGEHGGREPRLLAALLSADAAAALDIETVAYDRNVAPTVAYNVTVYMKPQKEAEVVNGTAVNATKVLLGFPAFDTLHYDPTVALTTPADVGYAVNSTAVTAAAPQNAARAVRAGMHVVLGVVAALVLLVV